jgi:hypothetical protein
MGPPFDLVSYTDKAVPPASTLPDFLAKIDCVCGSNDPQGTHDRIKDLAEKIIREHEIIIDNGEIIDDLAKSFVLALLLKRIGGGVGPRTQPPVGRPPTGVARWHPTYVPESRPLVPSCCGD